MLSMSLIRCKNEAMKKLHFKSIIKCFQMIENTQVTGFTMHISPIDCCVRINHKSDKSVYQMVTFSHGYLDSNCINKKFFLLLAVYLYTTDIKV